MTANVTPLVHRWWALLLLCVAQFLIILDTSIIGVALPAMQSALGFDAAGLQWIFNAYLIAFGGLVLLGGRLSDLFGARRIFTIGFLVLTAASLVAGMAGTASTLLASRAAQGVGAALIAPSALSLVMILFGGQPSELRRALGFWGAAAAAGGTAGVFLGGVITQWLSWRWTFLINVPVGLLVLAAVAIWLPAVQRKKGAVDVLGALLVTGAATLAVYAIVTANDGQAGTTPTIGKLVVGLAMFVAFCVLQAKRRDPLVPLSIFKAPNLSAGNLVMALLGGSWIPMWFFLNMYLQQVLGYGAFASGLALLPMTLTIMAMMMTVTEKVVGRLGPKGTLLTGLATLALAAVLFARMPVGGTFVAHVLLPSLLAAVGMSLSYIPAMITATMGAAPAEGGLASGLVNTAYQMGSAVGLALMVAVSQSTQLASGDASLIGATNSGFRAAFVGAAIIAAIAVVLAAFAVRKPRSAMRAPEVLAA